MERLTEKRDGQNVIPLRQNGKIKWSICSAGLGDAPTKYLYGDHADRLAAYEDTGLEPCDYSAISLALEKADRAQSDLTEMMRLAGEIGHDRLRELAQADLEGRIVLRSAGAGKKCGSCGHFHRIPGTKRGTCAIRRWERNRLGQTEPWRHSFTPSQSYGACREYVRGESSATEL